MLLGNAQSPPSILVGSIYLEDLVDLSCHQRWKKMLEENADQVQVAVVIMGQVMFRCTE